jgi:hypothetical protein
MTARKIPGRAQTDDEKREVVEKLLAAWQSERGKHLRLGQLIANSGIHDVFTVEDSELADLVTTFVAR